MCEQGRSHFILVLDFANAGLHYPHAFGQLLLGEMSLHTPWSDSILDVVFESERKLASPPLAMQTVRLGAERSSANHLLISFDFCMPFWRVDVV